MVLDTDTYNEIDDQFALVYALQSSDRLQVEAIYAAPFHNDRSSGPGDGMEKSYEEIVRLLNILGRPVDGFVYKGATDFLADIDRPVPSKATDDLIERALAAPMDDPLYVVAIGAFTNVATAILLEPGIIDRIVVVWLGGHALHCPNTNEFNLRQDLRASKLAFDSGVPLIQIPCQGVTSHLHTTVPEIEQFVEGSSPVGDYLAGIFKAYHTDPFGWSKPLWDVAAIAYLINPKWVPTRLIPSPILNDDMTWSTEPREDRSQIRQAWFVHRDPIFRDLFTKIKRAV